jgi:hypothetical protein
LKEKSYVKYKVLCKRKRKRYNQELYQLYWLPYIMRTTTAAGLWWTGQLQRMGNDDTRKSLPGSLADSIHHCYHNVKMESHYFHTNLLVQKICTFLFMAFCLVASPNDSFFHLHHQGIEILVTLLTISVSILRWWRRQPVNLIQANSQCSCPYLLWPECW